MGNRPFLITIVVIVLVGLSGFTYLELRSNLQTSNTTTDVISVNSFSGLQLKLEVNSIVLVNQTRGIEITVTEFNTKNHTNNVTASDNFSSHFLGQNRGFFPCDRETPLPFGFMLLNGSYSLENYTVAEPMSIWAGTYNCPIGYNASSYLFNASSDNATIALVPGFANCDALPCTLSNFQVIRTIALPPSTLPGTSIPGAFRKFRPGTYTVVAGDEWGAIVLLQFVIP